MGRPARARPVNESREAIARGQDVFNFTKINITGVAGINDATGQPVFPGACATCHSTPSAGDHSVKAPLNIGIANGPTNPPPALDISGLPVFTVVCTSGSNLLAPAGTPFQVTDIGRAMISGKMCRYRQVQRTDPARIGGARTVFPQRRGGHAARRRQLLRWTFRHRVHETTEVRFGRVSQFALR